METNINAFGKRPLEEGLSPEAARKQMKYEITKQEIDIQQVPVFEEKPVINRPIIRDIMPRPIRRVTHEESIQSRIQDAKLDSSIPSYATLLGRVHEILQTADPICEDLIRIIVPYIVSNFRSRIIPPLTATDVDVCIDVALINPQKKIFVKGIYDALSKRVTNQTLQTSAAVLTATITSMWAETQPIARPPGGELKNEDIKHCSGIFPSPLLTAAGTVEQKLEHPPEIALLEGYKRESVVQEVPIESPLQQKLDRLEKLNAVATTNILKERDSNIPPPRSATVGQTVRKKLRFEKISEEELIKLEKQAGNSPDLPASRTLQQSEAIALKVNKRAPVEKPDLPISKILQQNKETEVRIKMRVPIAVKLDVAARWVMSIPPHYLFSQEDEDAVLGLMSAEAHRIGAASVCFICHLCSYQTESTTSFMKHMVANHNLLLTQWRAESYTSTRFWNGEMAEDEFIHGKSSK